MFDYTVCSGETIPLTTLLSLPVSSTISWTGNNSTIGLVSNGNGDVPSFKAINKTGTLQSDVISITPSFQGCLGTTSSYKVNVNASPVSAFGYSPDIPSIIEPTIHFNETGQYAQSYVWNFGDGSPDDNSQNPVHTYQDTGCYTVRLISENANGCRDTVFRQVCVESDFTFYIPNAFSPNGDGNNDVFLPVGFGVVEREFEMLIFDRLGEQVFSSKSIENGWTGNGSRAPFQVGPYLYKIHCRDTNGKEITGPKPIENFSARTPQRRATMK